MSAITAALSLTCAQPSLTSVTGSDHDRPPSLDVETRTAVSRMVADLPPMLTARLVR
jgi:hypothetical protein